jgi:hypothetical protein
MTSRTEITDRDGKLLWDPATGRFDGARLRLALVLRELSPDELARDGGCSRTSVYKALAGHGVRDRTAIALLRGLARHPRKLPELD